MNNSIQLIFLVAVFFCNGCDFNNKTVHSDALEFGIKGHPRYIHTQYSLVDEDQYGTSGNESQSYAVKLNYIIDYFYDRNGNFDSIISYTYLHPEKKKITIYKNSSHPRIAWTLNEGKLIDSMYFNWVNDTSYVIERRNPAGRIIRKDLFQLNHHYRDLSSTLTEFGENNEMVYQRTYANQIDKNNRIRRTWTKESTRADTLRSICVYDHIDKHGNALEALLFNQDSTRIVKRITREITYY